MEQTLEGLEEMSELVVITAVDLEREKKGTISMDLDTVTKTSNSGDPKKGSNVKYEPIPEAIWGFMYSY